METENTVNGVSALVYGSQFAANHVSLEQGANDITALATDSAGTAESTSIEVFSEPENDYIRLTPDEESGVSPFETTLRLDATFDITEEPYITYSGPGIMDIVKIEDEYRYTITTSTPGLYFITAEVENSGITHSDIIVILVMDEVALDAMLQAKWNGMKNALMANDVEGALENMADISKDMFEYNFNLMIDHLPEIAAGLQNITLVRFGDGFAEYEMWAEQGGQTTSFVVYFVRDADGIWRVQSF